MDDLSHPDFLGTVSWSALTGEVDVGIFQRLNFWMHGWMGDVRTAIFHLQKVNH
jgi:hypothetical protein